MRNKFFDLIEKGVAPFSYINTTGKETPGDEICREYNNIFSIVSDTHMTEAPSELQDHYPTHKWLYVITGALINRNGNEWTKWCCDPTLGGTLAFTPYKITCYFSACSFFEKWGLVGEKLFINGELSYGLYSVTEEVELNDPNISTNNTSLKSLNYYNTNESNIPQPITSLSINSRRDDVIECVNGKKSVQEIARAFNESNKILGENWCGFEDNVIVGYFANNKVVILKINQ